MSNNSLCMQAALEEPADDEDTTATDGTANMTSLAAPKARKVLKPRKKTFRVPLTMSGPGFHTRSMSADERKVDCC